MNLQLKRLRKQAGFKTQKDIATALGVPERRYASWEREEVMMSLEQACNVTELLGCTLEELVGRKSPRTYADKRQAAVNGYYESMSDDGKGTLLKVAKGLAKDGANRIEKDRAECVQDASAIGA